MHSQIAFEAIAHALDIMPGRIRERVACDFLVGVDPIFVGLHSYGEIEDGRSYRDTAHVAYPCHQDLVRSARRTTVVVPAADKYGLWLRTLVHELGHVLHEHIGFTHVALPLNEYSKNNNREAFAESFTAWLLRPEEYQAQWVQLRQRDPATLALLESLA